MVTLIPRRLALLSSESGRLKLIDPPYTAPSVDISLIYLKDRLAEPAIAWMREQIRSTAATI
jgi:DNA-binding transcriptional LysR family regulator